MAHVVPQIDVEHKTPVKKLVQNMLVVKGLNQLLDLFRVLRNVLEVCLAVTL
jgi:hypothetical protein